MAVYGNLVVAEQATDYTDYADSEAIKQHLRCEFRVIRVIRGLFSSVVAKPLASGQSYDNR
jgi:hypothetical protein